MNLQVTFETNRPKTYQNPRSPAPPFIPSLIHLPPPPKPPSARRPAAESGAQLRLRQLRAAGEALALLAGAAGRRAAAPRGATLMGRRGGGRGAGYGGHLGSILQPPSFRTFWFCRVHGCKIGGRERERGGHSKI